MSGMVECYLINQDGRQCNFSPAVTNTRVIFGKNQPFLGVEITVAKYMFDSDDFWSGQTPSGTALLTRPELIQNSTLIHIKTYGGEYDLVYTQTLNPDDMTYVLLCYTKMWQSKTTEVSSLISDIVWSGQSGTYDSGTLAITCNGITTNTQIGGVFLPTDGAGVSKNNVQLVKPSRVNVTPPASLASIGTLRVLVPIYQDPTIPTDALVGYTEPTGEVSFDDLEHTMRADTVYASILFEYAGPFSKQDLNNYYKGIFANLIIPQIAYVLHPLNKVQQNINGEMVVRSGMQEDGILYCKGVEYVTGYGQTLFAWLSNAIGGYVGTDLVIDKGYKMESSAEILSKLGFDTETLAAYKANDNPPTARTYGDSIYKLVPDTICYDLIKAVSIATNRTAFFADVPYLSSFEVAESEHDNALSELTIQYTPSDSSYCAYFIPLGETEPQQITLGSGVEYNDQGSTYLVGEQTARSANASVTVKATDAGTDIAGMPVEVNIDTASIDSSKEILAQVAFNTLVENYHPSNTLSFIALENTSIPIETTYVAYMTLAAGLPDPSPSNNGKYYINAGVADVNLYLSNGTTWTATTPSTGQSVTVHAPSNTYYFVFNGTVWNEYRAYAGVERHALFRPDTRCATLEDTRSHTTLTNVPLAYTVLSWPDCTTRYMFGEPIFQDTEETIADLQAISKQSVTNTSVSEALSKPYVTTVIGNMSLDEAGDDLTDFSGLILQRNESTGVASMDGYMGGQRQARFSSDGAISSGVVTYHSPRSSDPTVLSEAGDSVVMDRDGFHTRSWHLYPQTSPQFSYADGYWVEETRIGVDGEISAGAGSVVLGHDGLTNYDSDGEPAYTLDDDGLKYKGQPIIDSKNGKIQLKVDGAAIDGNLRAISITLPFVQIDNEGMRTFSKYLWDTESEQYLYPLRNAAGTETYLQCSVGTNGVITAGAGAVKLDQYGLSTWTWTSPDAKITDIVGAYDYTPPQYDEHGALVKDGAIQQCAVTTNGELIAGANLYKLDASGLSYNFGQGTSLVNWQNILTYNATEDRVELYPSIYVEAAEIDSLSADKITTGTLRATTSIAAGDATTGWAVLDGSGLKLYYPGANPISEGSSRTPIVWVDANGYHMKTGRTDAEKANIQYGSWASHIDPTATALRTDVNLLSNVNLNVGPVCATAPVNPNNDPTVYYSVVLSDKGLKTYSYTTNTPDPTTGYVTSVTQVEQCSIGTDGSIVAGAGAVKLDSVGLRTYIAGTSSEQCRIGTDGEISAGEDTIKLSSAGMTMGVVSSTSSATVLSMSDASYLEIIDGSLIPAVQLSSGGSNFKNGLNTESAIVSQEGYKCGQYNAGLSPGTVTIEAVVGGTSTKQSYSSLVVSPSTMRICRGTFNDIHKCFVNNMKDYDVEYAHARQYEEESNNIYVSGSVHPEILDPWVMLEGGWGINEYLELSYDSTRKSENWPSYKVVQTQHNTATDFDDLFPLRPEVENNTLVFNPLSEIYVTTPLQLVQTWSGNMYESFQTRIGYTKLQYAYIYQSGELLPAMLRVSTSGKLYLKDVYGYVEQEAGTIIDPNQQYYFKQSNTNYVPIEFNILHPVTYYGYEVIHSDYLVAKEDTNVDTDKYTFYSASSISAKSDTDRIYITHKIPVKMTASSSLPKHIQSTGISPTAIYITGTIPRGITVVEYNIKYSLAQSAHVYPLLLGAFYASGAGSVVVSEGGLYGTTRIPSGVSGDNITFTDYALSPLVNQTYLQAYTSAVLASYTTPPATLGLKRIIAVPYGTSSISADFKVGDIIMYYS